MTVAELLSRISSHELTEWMVYEEIAGPLGGERYDHLHALMAATLVETQRSKGPRPRPVDHMPPWSRREQTSEEQITAVRQINQALGGTTRTREG